MLALLSLLGNLRNDFNIDVLTFKAVHVELYFIHQKDHAALTIGIALEVIIITELKLPHLAALMHRLPSDIPPSSDAEANPQK